MSSQPSSQLALESATAEAVSTNAAWVMRTVLPGSALRVSLGRTLTRRTDKKSTIDSNGEKSKLSGLSLQLSARQAGERSRTCPTR